MELRSVRHDKALRLAEQKILCSRLAPEKKGNREIKREIIYLKGSITEEDIDAPEIDLKVVFGDKSCYLAPYFPGAGGFAGA